MVVLYSTSPSTILPGPNKNRTLIEAARTMLQDADLQTSFWAEAINTACYIQNRTLINKSVGNTPYFIIRVRKPITKNLYVFDKKCYILKDNYEHIGKFVFKDLEAIFLGYSLERTTYRVYVINQEKVMEIMISPLMIATILTLVTVKKRIHWPLKILMKNLRVMKKFNQMKNQKKVKGTLKIKIFKKRESSYCLRTHPS